ncbi:MAG TPA: hypothetical protein VFV69_07910 [Steroidobacteraceae bacterium]|nr:hypothetical protein [Steroidobacteraceae bacterium]
MIVTRELPPDALPHEDRERGASADCYTTDVPLLVSHAAYVEAFYTSWAFKLERFVLKWTVAKPSTDDEARRLSRGELDAFAAWTIDARARDQVLLVDFMRRTKSWLMVAALDATHTRLYFGTVIMPVRKKTGPPSIGLAFGALMPFHKAYSRVLLGAAAARITRSARQLRSSR